MYLILLHIMDVWESKRWHVIDCMWLRSIGYLNVMSFAEPRRFKFDPSQIESVDQMLLGARIAQNSLSPVAEESIDGGEQQPLYSEKLDKTLERYHLLQLDFNATNKIYLSPLL